MGSTLMPHGLASRLTQAGVPVLRVHYSADPKKRPGTPEGDAWLEAALQGYPGGLRCPRWRKEFEIDYGALGGTKLFPEWDLWKENGRIVIPPFDPHGYVLYGSYDHGWRHPACYLVHGIHPDGSIVTLWEFYGAQVPYQKIAQILKGEAVRLSDGREFPGNPFAGRERYRVADCSIFAEDKPQDDGTMKSTAKLFRREGIHFLAAEQGGDITFAEWLHGYWWREPTEPLWRITTACPNLLREIGCQRHKEFSAQVSLTRAQPEELVDKDNDAFDAWKYFGMRFPPKPEGRKPAEHPNTFAWWQKQSKRAAHGQTVGTFRREMMVG